MKLVATFACRSCGVVAHADWNTACNIADRAEQTWAAVNRPHAAIPERRGRVAMSESTTLEQLARRVAALEQLAETNDILDRTEAVAARQRQMVEQCRTGMLEKLSSTQDEHTAALQDLKTRQSETTEQLARVNERLDGLRQDLSSGNARIIELLTNLVGRNPNAD